MELKKLDFLPIAVASYTPLHSIDGNPIAAIAYCSKIIEDDLFKILTSEKGLLVKDALLRWGIKFPTPTKACVVEGVERVNVSIDKINGKDIGHCTDVEVIDDIIAKGYTPLLNVIFQQFVEERIQKKLDRASNS